MNYSTPQPMVIESEFVKTAAVPKGIETAAMHGIAVKPVNRRLLLPALEDDGSQFFQVLQGVQ